MSGVVRAARLAFSGLACCACALVLVACEEDGKTAPSTCPELPLYDVSDENAASAAGNPAILEDAASKGCVTATGHATSPGPALGSGGEAAGLGGDGG